MNNPAPVRMATDEWQTLGPLLTPSLGRLLHVLETPSVTLRHAFYEAGAEVGWHQHPIASLVYGVGGPCLERDGDGRECMKRRFSYHPAGYAHSLAYQAPTHVLVFELSPEIIERLPNESRRLPATLYNQLWHLFVSLSRNGSDQSAQTALERLVGQVIAYLELPLHPRMAALLESIHTDWDRPIEPARTAKIFGVSPQLVRRQFKRALGVNLPEYRRLIQLDYARALLWGSRARVAQVAAQTAFADQSHLCRVLRENTNVSPLELRRAAPCLAEAFEQWMIQPIE